MYDEEFDARAARMESVDDWRNNDVDCHGEGIFYRHRCSNCGQDCLHSYDVFRGLICCNCGFGGK